LIAAFGEDDAGCLAFDLACQLRLEIHDNEVRAHNAKLIAYEVAKLWTGTTDDGNAENGNIKEQVW